MVETHIGHRLVEQAVPGRTTGDPLVMQQPLDFLVQLVRPEKPRIVDPGLVFRRFRRLELFGEDLVVDLVELELEKQRMG